MNTPDKMDYLIEMRDYIKKQIQFIEECEQLSASVNKKYKKSTMFLSKPIDEDYIELQEKFKELHTKDFFKGRYIDLQDLLNKVIIAIYANCEHICCVDYVDVSEDKMQKIQYCEKCWTEF
jgi:phosphoenolpyruvate-protein kinase (PTS system EI component)